MNNIIFEKSYIFISTVQEFLPSFMSPLKWWPISQMFLVLSHYTCIGVSLLLGLAIFTHFLVLIALISFEKR